MDKKIKLRKAEKEDCKDVWRWRNAPEVRKWSFSQEEIPYDAHKKWFLNRINDQQTELYIAESEKREKIGQARFDKDKGDTHKISVNLNPEFLGKGYGSLLIREATLVYLFTHAPVSEVWAEIMDNNIVSQKAFAKAGYIPQVKGPSESRGRVWYVYRRQEEKVRKT